MLKLNETLLPYGKLTTAILIGLLTACGSGGGSDNILGTTTVIDTDEDGATAEDGSVRIGSGSDTSFSVGDLAVGIGATASLSAGGSTTFTATVVDAASALVTDETTFDFTSGCVTAGSASFDAASVVTSNGTATVTYTAEGCTGDDTISASAEGLSAVATITVEAEDVIALEFVSAVPPIISITGTGGVAASTLTFKILGESGNPVSGQSVTFQLDTSVGSVNIPAERLTAVSDINGEVTTIVQAGSIPTPVRVTATDDATGIATQSSGLSIGTAITDDNSFDAVIPFLNPSAWDFTGNTMQVSAFLGDAFNNTPPDDTAVSFTTNGGVVQSTCSTVGGSCSVTWTGQNPRPAFTDFDGDSQPGDAIILAYTTGVESFDDDNGDGFFGDGESFTDVGEPYFDENQDEIYNVGEGFVDADGSKDYTSADGMYNGPSCEHSSLCSDQTVVTIWASIPFVMSGNAMTLFYSAGATMPAVGSNLVVVEDVISSFSGLFIGDQNGNAPPIGTSISVSAGNGTLESTSGFTVESAYFPVFLPISISGDSESSGGLLTVTVDPPNAGAQEFTWTISD